MVKPQAKTGENRIERASDHVNFARFVNRY